MTYTIATIVSLAAIGGLIFQPSSQMAQAQTIPPAAGPVVTNPTCGDRVTGVVILLNNEIGVFMTGADHAQLAMDLFLSNNIGFATHSVSDLALKSNTFSNNRLAGITLVNTHGATLDTNNVQGSDNGIFTDSQSEGNHIVTNSMKQNKIDINNANGLPSNINSNQFVGNNCDTSNPSGICIAK
jgi:parallel beta-helix repeat protein